MQITPDKPHSPLSLAEIGAIVAIVVIWGANNAAAKVATEVLPPLMTGAIRFAIAALCLIPFVRPPFPNWKSLLLIVTLGGPLHYGLLYWGFSLADDLSPVAVASQLWIPFTTLFAFLLLGERLSIPALIGMIVALVGVAWMSVDPTALHDWPAILAIVAAAAFWGMTTVIARRTTSIPPLKMQGLLACVALPTLAFGSAMFERDQVEAVRAATPLIWVCLLWAGVISSVFATSMVFWLVQKREAGRVTPYFLATPVVSIAIGWGLLGDVITPQILAGAALTMGGVAVVALAERGLRAGAAKA
ncbi:MAG: DMT family transporter [Alphaproteobacteria bacterium]|nr:DMT family transporter [Alphaproteobacteria bacterium]MBU2379949.1 DMT family transporter [Alphaproteobacteria bacterium]